MELAAGEEPLESAVAILVTLVCTNNSDLGAVRHAEFEHNLPNMNLNGTFRHPQPAGNSFIRLAKAQELKNGLLPRR